jgi:outer membrane lipoprotein-sorting protein
MNAHTIVLLVLTVSFISGCTQEGQDSVITGTTLTKGQDIPSTTIEIEAQIDETIQDMFIEDDIVVEIGEMI